MATKWTQEDMSKAIQDVTGTKMSIRKAALKHAVPRTTLQNHLLGNVQSGAKPGPPYSPYQGRRDSEVDNENE